ncbi:MAG: DUF4178 domain-containing protein [Flavobacteriales bacterium]|nr:DUF4178 domain-containing protein [Flavobacteriales bacterium]
MGLFDFFKKKNKEEDTLSQDLSFKDLKKGDMIDYFLKSWQVEGVTEYDWGNNIFSREFKLYAGDEMIYAEIDEEEEEIVSISKDIKISKIQKGLKSYIIENDAPPKTLDFNGEKYTLNEENLGQCYEPGSSDFTELVNWTFTDEDENKFISIDRWDETDIEASIGEYAKIIEFSNIIRS